jgi:hypothetical protein
VGLRFEPKQIAFKALHMMKFLLIGQSPPISLEKEKAAMHRV